MFPTLTLCLVLASEATRLAREMVRSKLADWVDVVPAGSGRVAWRKGPGPSEDQALLLIFGDDSAAEEIGAFMEAVSSVPVDLEALTLVHPELLRVRGFDRT